MRSKVSINKRARRGLTLIELVVVVAILAILAGFIVPRLGFVRNLAASASNATTISESATQAVFYNTAVGHYPGGEDSLLDTANAVYANINSKLFGALSVLDLSTDNKAAQSIVSQIDPNSATATLYYGTAGGSTLSTPNTDFTNPVAITWSKSAGGAGHVAKITPPVAADLPTASNTTGNVNYQIYLASYGAAKLSTTTGAPLDNTFLVALGYGQNSEINGTTGLEAPVLFNKAPGEYTRPILLLKVFGTTSTVLGVPPGTSATTATSIGFDGTTVNANLAKYNVDQNR